MTLLFCIFRDGLWRFFDEDSFLEVPPLGTSGPSQAPSVYVADLGVCILEYALHAHSPLPLTRFFLAPLGETSDYGQNFRFEAIFPIFCCLSDSSFLGSYTSPKPVWKGPKRTHFIHVKRGHSLIQPRPSMTDALVGTRFQFSATVRLLSSRRGM